MPYWVIADTENHKRAMMGPYESYSKALSIRDGLDDGHARIFETGSRNRQEAAREIRHQLVKEGRVENGWKNFRHKGISSEIS